MTVYAIIDDTDPRLEYTGEWQVLTDPVNPRASDYNGTIHVTNDPNATVTYNFYGSMLNVFGTIDTPSSKGYPNATFAIGSNTPIHLNQTGYMPTLLELKVATTHLELFTSDILSTGNYTMTLRTDGVFRGGPSFYFDYLTVQLPDSVATPVERVVVDDIENTKWNFTGNWTVLRKPGTYLYSAHQTNGTDSSATLSFEGTDITVYGTMNGGYGSTTPLAYFQLDGGENRLVMAAQVPSETVVNDGTLMRHQKFFSASGLGQGAHTLSIVAASPGADTLSWGIDYAVYGPVLSNTPGITPTSSPSSTPPVGAIAGGVAGGIVGIAAVVVLFLLWRRKKQRDMTRAKVWDDGLPLAPSESKMGTRTPSMHKPLGQQHPSTPLSPVSGSLDESLPDGTMPLGVGESGVESEEVRKQGNGEVENVRVRRELDGGVRLDEDLIELVLPPSYARYG